MRICYVCNEEKPENMFYGNQHKCKNCRRLHVNEQVKIKRNERLSKPRPCPICGIEKNNEEFVGDKINAPCKQCKKDKQQFFNQRKYDRYKRERICVKCGGEVFGNKKLCVKCAEKSNNSGKKRQHDLKRRCIEYKGGACAACGIVSEQICIYDFHHVNPREKDGEISKMMHAHFKFEEMIEELDKTILLCSNCHRIQHYAIKVEGK